MERLAAKMSPQMLVLGGAILLAALLALAIRIGPQLGQVILKLMMPNA